MGILSCTRISLYTKVMHNLYLLVNAAFKNADQVLYS